VTLGKQESSEREGEKGRKREGRRGREREREREREKLLFVKSIRPVTSEIICIILLL